MHHILYTYKILKFNYSIVAARGLWLPRHPGKPATSHLSRTFDPLLRGGVFITFFFSYTLTAVKIAVLL